MIDEAVPGYVLRSRRRYPVTIPPAPRIDPDLAADLLELRDRMRELHPLPWGHWHDGHGAVVSGIVR